MLISRLSRPLKAFDVISKSLPRNDFGLVEGKHSRSCRKLDFNHRLERASYIAARSCRTTTYTFPKPRPVQQHSHIKMAAAIKALNARIRANPVSDYLCSTREFFLRLGSTELTRVRGRVKS